jgi:transcriptional regulator with PAS, ATPase and Fis domain
MSGIALFVPNNKMYRQAQSILEGMENHHVVLIKKTTTEEVTSEAQKAISMGINVIIARGRQAVEIKNTTNVTVTNIILTAQELGLLIMKAKNLISKERITVGLFGWGNMFCDTSHFEELFGITLKQYTLSDEEEWRNVILNATTDHLDVIIGGKSVLEYANQLGVPGIYLSGTGESLAISIREAESLYRMAEIEKLNYSQFSTVLGSSFNGIIKLSVLGKILIMNRVMEEIIGKNANNCIGVSIAEVFSSISQDKITEVLDGTSDNYSTVLSYKGQELVLVMEPIVVEQTIEGAILSFNRLRRLNDTDKTAMTKHILMGHVAHGTFEDIHKNMKGLSKVVDLAKLYAMTSSPMLIEALSGPELDVITQGIHNHGMRKNGPFIMIHLAGMNEEQQLKALFGNEDTKEEGALLEAHRGTLVVLGIDKLTLPNQYKFFKAIRSKRLLKGDSLSDSKLFDTRIIACTTKNLTDLRKKLLFRSDLYFTLISLRLRIPNLNDRPNDVEYLLTTYMKQYTNQYSRYHVLSPMAKKALMEYAWEGNSIQLQSFCERMILTAQHRTISEEYVTSLLGELYHSNFDFYDYSPSNDAKKEDSDESDESYDPMYDLLIKTLKKYHGNRKLAAKELQISTTTLWRKMKKYGLIEE